VAVKSTPNQRVEAATARRRSILKYAQGLFRRHGYSHASLNSIVRHAGGSKASIAKFFGNKAGLFAAVMEEVTRDFVAQLERIDMGGGPDAGLVRLGVAILGFYLDPAALMTYRAVVGEGHRQKAMAAAFYGSAHGAVVNAVAMQLLRWHAEGRLVVEDARAEADRFTHILRSGLYEQTLLGLRAHAPMLEDIEAVVRPAVRGFLHGSMAPSGRGE
jgi:AcrR family transcriptional regulator